MGSFSPEFYQFIKAKGLDKYYAPAYVRPEQLL